MSFKLGLILALLPVERGLSMLNDTRLNILIAVDPTEPELRLTANKLSWLHDWTKARNAKFEAVYVKSGHSKTTDLEEAELTQSMKALPLHQTLQCTLLQEPSSSKVKVIQCLLEHAQKKNVNLIVVSSHGRSGAGRLVLGSFAESLLANSPLPILFLNESVENRSKTNKILFPTDFSAASKVALDLLLKTINPDEGELILFHAVPPPGAIGDTGILGVPLYMPEHYWSELEAWTKEESHKLLVAVKEKGFRARFEIHHGIKSTAFAIEQIAVNENVDLIAMASISHGLDAFIAGSVAKEIFRAKKWPVLIYGPEALLREVPQSVTLI